MRKLSRVTSVLLVATFLLCFSSYAERSLKTPIKLKFAIGGHSVSTTTIDFKFLIHHEVENMSNQDSQSRNQSIKNETEYVYIHIEGEIIPNRHRRNSYTIRVQGKVEMEFTSKRSPALFADQANIPDSPGAKSEHERREMEIRVSTVFKAGQKKTLASKDGFDVELRLEEDVE